jgi:hypothetical protein
VNVKVDGQDLIVHSDHVHQNVQEMDIVTMQHVSVNLDSQEFIVHFQHVHHHVQEMEDVFQLVHKWVVNVMKDTKDMIVLKKHVQVIVLEMENALVVFVLVKMVGVDLIVLLVVLDMVKDVVEMENVLKDNATAIQDGQDMVVIFEHASMTAHNTVIAAMELASAKKDTVVEIAHFHLNHNHASAQFTVFVDAFNNAQKFMRLKVLDHHMNATQNAPKNAFHSVLLEKCLII